MKTKFKLGDRIIHKDYGKGTIIGIRDSTIPFIVEFDKGNSEIFHDGFSATKNIYGKDKGKDNHCFWCIDEELKLVKEDKKKLIKENQGYVTREEFEEFKKSIQPIEKQEEKPKDRADKDQKYWYLDEMNVISSHIDIYDDIDNYYYKTGNYYLTEEECKRAKEIQDILLKYSYNFSIEELLNNNVSKYEIYVDIDDKILRISNSAYYLSTLRLFKTTEDCQKALDEIGYEDFIKYCVKGNIK